jgi:hypothetical protein
VSVTLAEALATRSPDQIAAILTARPDVTVPPVPRNLPELAERLEIFHSVAIAVRQLPAPALQVIEVLQLLGPGAGERDALAGWLGRAADDPALTAALEWLESWALAWTGDDQNVRLATPLYQAFRYPLRLGAPAAALLARYPTEHLRPIARTLGLPSAGRKPDLIAGIAGLLTDPDRVRGLVAGAGAAVRTRLRRLAADGPAADHFATWYGYQQPEPELRWAAERGLVLADSWGVPQLPQEAAVALRGPGWHAPFTPRQPHPRLVDVTDDTVEREAAAAGAAAVEQLTAVLEAVATTPPALLKAGGLGVKELRRLARTLGIEEAGVRLWLELGYQADLVSPVRDRSGPAHLLPTPGYDEWAEAEPADRLAAVLPVWLDLPAGPLLPTGAEPGKPAPALVRDHDGQLVVAVRHQLMRLAAGLPAGRGVGHGGGLTDAVGWLCPLLADQYPDFGWLVGEVWREAQSVGVVGHGALTSLGRALAGTGGDHRSSGELPAPDPDEVAAACRKLLPAAAVEAVFQADLTALVPGTPARPLAELLDATADRESRGGAVTWRFTAGSVRRALDAGFQAEPLLAALRARSAGGTLPQPLAYLVTDLARRHGAVRVRGVASVLRSDDPALLTELAGARALRPLRLSVLAPTVLGSAKPVAETLAAVRAAGYAPVGESADGVPQVERVPRRRAGGPRPPGGRRELPDGRGPAHPARPDPRELASRLLAARQPAGTRRAPAGTRRAPAGTREAAVGARGAAVGAREVAVGVREVAVGPQPVELVAELADRTGQLAPGERRLLAHAITTEGAVTIGYTNAQGDHTTRVIDSVELDGAHLIAWCHLRDEERMFSLHRIDTVAPAP